VRDRLAGIAVRRGTGRYYACTAISTLATSYYLNYLFFHLRDRFGFGNRENLAAAALHGSLYMVSAWQAGRFAERHGFRTSLLLGSSGLVIVMIAGALAPTTRLEILTLASYSLVLLLIWPALEALVIQGEPPSRVPHVVGLYNCTWSGSAAVAYFTGGDLYARFGAGAVFWLPAVLFAAQALFILSWPRDTGSAQPAAGSLSTADADRSDARPPQASHATTRPAVARVFLRLAWVGNPFSYVAMYTLLAVMPGLVAHLGIPADRVGIFCSVWMFGRLAAFIVLWQWTGWHYRFGWLAGGYIVLLVSFVFVLTVPALLVIVVAQAVFGFACGLMYYSSLFYAMDVGEAPGEHGGLHEAAIGAGIAAGPAVGALSLALVPDVPHAGAMAVTALLGAGLAVMLSIWHRRPRGILAPRP
jgi:predicted MFS family arabinose efflux permease